METFSALLALCAGNFLHSITGCTQGHIVSAAVSALQLRHKERDGVSNHQPHDCLLNRLFRRRSKKTSKLRVTGLCEGNALVICEFPAQKASNAENVSSWWRHHDIVSVATVVFALLAHIPVALNIRMSTNMVPTDITTQQWTLEPHWHVLSI